MSMTRTPEERLRALKDLPQRPGELRRQLLADCFERPRPTMHPDEAERIVRERMVNEVDDLKVSYQVLYARSIGSPGFFFVHHQCNGPYADCVRGAHGYYMSCVGPRTLAAHLKQEQCIAEMPALMEEFARLMRDIPASVFTPSNLEGKSW